MIMSFIAIAVGLTLLVVGGEVLLRGAVRVATALRLTPAIIGLTVVAAATSVPELAVSVGAAMSGKVDIAVGNVVGSNIANVALILGLSACFRALSVSGSMIRLEYPVMWLASFLLVVLAADGSIGRLDGVYMLVFYLLFTTYVVSLVRTRMEPSENAQVNAAVQEIHGSNGMLGSIGLISLSILLLGGGAELTVHGAVEIAKWVGISDRVIGLTIVAVGTSLPEVVASIISAYRGRGDIAIGNIIGSNIFNILIILGFSSVLSPLPVNTQIANSDNWWMLGLASLLFPLMYTQLTISRREGSFLLMVYGVYLWTLLSIAS